jgi:hypothetical protein
VLILSNIIDLLNKDNTGEKQKALEVFSDPFKRYRTLYFDNNIDLRLCPKNGNQTLQYIWGQLHLNKDSRCNTALRKELYEELLQQNKIEEGEFLFRKGSYRVAVKRDPVERVLSSAKYILRTRLNIKNPSVDMIEELLNDADFETDFHFLPQTFWMGTQNLYNEIYSIRKLDNLVDFIEKDYPWLGKIKDKNKNISESKIKVKDLSNSTIRRWINIYMIDYDNGWY